jgi:WD40 repeat protein
MVWDVATRKLLLSRSITTEDKPVGTGSSVSGSLSLSDNGKRVAVSVRFTSINRNSEGNLEPGRPSQDKVVAFAFDVDSQRILFDSAKNQVELSPGAVALLSHDGRKLIANEAARNGRSMVWDLDAGEKKPVIIDEAAAVNFSPDGTHVIGMSMVTENRRTTKIWDAATGKELLSLPIADLVYSPRGTYLAGAVLVGEREGGQTRTLKVFDATTGKEISSTPLTGALSEQVGRGVSIFPLVFARDESLVAVAHRASSGTPRTEWFFVEPKTGKIRHTLEDPDASRGGAGFGFVVGFGLGRGFTWPRRFLSGDASLFICPADNTIHTLNVATGRHVHTFRGHENQILAAALLPDKPRLRTVEADGTLKEWDLQPPRPPARIAVAEEPSRMSGGIPLGRVRTHTVSADGAWVARAAPGDGEKPDTVQVWDVAANGTTILEARARAAQSSTGLGVVLSADGKRVALSRYELRFGGFGADVDPQKPAPPPDVTVWDVATKKELLHLELPPGGGADWFAGGGMSGFSLDGGTIVLTRRDTIDRLPNGNLKTRTTLWSIHVDSRRPGPSIAIGGNVIGGSSSPDGQRFAGFIRNPLENGSWTDQFAVWDLVRGTQLFAIDPGFPSAGGFGTTAIWSPDGSRVTLVDVPGSQVHLLDAATGKFVQTLKTAGRGAFGPMARIAFSPDGRRLACEFRQRFTVSGISVLDTESGKELLSLPMTAAPASPATTPTGASLTFTPDGHQLLRFETAPSTRTTPDGKAIRESALQVTTWDATPLPEATQP